MLAQMPTLMSRMAITCTIQQRRAGTTQQVLHTKPRDLRPCRIQHPGPNCEWVSQNLSQNKASALNGPVKPLQPKVRSLRFPWELWNVGSSIAERLSSMTILYARQYSWSQPTTLRVSPERPARAC